MAEQKLNQVIPVERALKSRIEADRTALYHTLQKTALFDGMNRSYRPLKDGSDKMPPENKKVQQKAWDIVEQLSKRMITLWDITATRDAANCLAKADLVVGDTVLLRDVPSSHLLYLEQELIHVRTLIDHMPTLDPAENWALDTLDDLYKTNEIEKMRTQKVSRPIVLYNATVEHPAQTQLISEDINVGTWVEQKVSGAVPEFEKQQLLDRVELLQVAVKRAREKANLVDAPQVQEGKILFDWLFGGE